MISRSRDTTRAVLLESALELFVRYGYQAISHSDIAAEAGIGRTTFYEYFSNKEELLVELVATKLPELTSELVAAVPDGLSPPQQLGELTARMIEFVGTDHLGLLLHSEVPRLSDGAQLQIAAAHTHLSEAFADIYRRGVEAGDFRPLPGRLAGRLVYEVIMTAGREVMDSDDPKQQVHSVADAAVEFLLGGLTG
jgi:AcrR family transcriptional regulator